jgi:hypothetical protein
MVVGLDLSGSFLFDAEAYSKAFKDREGKPMLHPGHSKVVAHKEAIIEKMKNIGEQRAYMTINLPIDSGAPGFVEAEAVSTRLIQRGQVDNKELYLNVELMGMASLVLQSGSKPQAVDISKEEVANRVDRTAEVVVENNPLLSPIPDDESGNMAAPANNSTERMDTKGETNNKRGHAGDSCTKDESNSTEGALILYSENTSEIVLPAEKKSKAEYLLLNPEYNTGSVIEDAWRNYSADDDDEASISAMLKDSP